jgi:hypothetical protein
LERAGRVAAFMWPTLNAARSHIQADLMRACQQAGQPERAERIAREFLREASTRPQAERMHAADRVLREYCWLLQSQGRAKEALEELGRWYAPRPGGADVSGQLHLERAYLHAAVGDWDGVAADVAELLTPDGRVKEDYGYHTHSSYWLLVGFLKERQGDREGAKAAWRAGTFPAWRKSAMKDAATGGGHAVVNRMILAGLAEEMDAAEADAILAELWRSEADGFVGRLAGTLGPAPAAALRTMWGTPRGRGYARRFAFRELPFDAVLRVPPQLLVSEVVRQGAFGDWSPRQEQLCWDVVTDAYDRFVTGKVGTTQMFQLGLTWKGTTGFLGWASVAPTLPPEFRGPVAYVIGHRLLRLKRPADAKTFFQTALKDAPPCSPLLRLAEDELERLGGK